MAGEGSRIPADKLREAMQQSRSLEKVFLRFAHSFMNQTANTAFSNGTATLEERLARWLLMAHDRLEGEEIPLTHEFLSLMLGVRRVGVTVALNYLKHRGVIRLSRGYIAITDREGLKTSANGTYHQPEGNTRSYRGLNPSRWLELHVATQPSRRNQHKSPLGKARLASTAAGLLVFENVPTPLLTKEGAFGIDLLRLSWKGVI